MATCNTVSLIDYIGSLNEATELFGNEQLILIQGGSAMQVSPTLLQDYFATKTLVLTGANSDTFTDSNLVGTNILLVTIDVNVVPSADYTFDNTTGEIVFTQPVDTGLEVQILYNKNFS